MQFCNAAVVAIKESQEILREVILIGLTQRADDAEIQGNKTPKSLGLQTDQNIAWILFSSGIDIYEASQYWQVIGNQDLGRHVLSLRPFDE